MRQTAEFIAVLSCTLFTGAAVYITLVEHPARMQCGMERAATEFAPSYCRATVMQATCAAVGLLSSVAAWLTGAGFWWLIAGVLLGSVIPFTLIVILLLGHAEVVSQFVRERLADLLADFCLVRTDRFDVLLIKHDVGGTCRNIKDAPLRSWHAVKDAPKQTPLLSGLEW